MSEHSFLRCPHYLKPRYILSFFLSENDSYWSLCEDPASGILSKHIWIDINCHTHQGSKYLIFVLRRCRFVSRRETMIFPPAFCLICSKQMEIYVEMFSFFNSWTKDSTSLEQAFLHLYKYLRSFRYFPIRFWKSVNPSYSWNLSPECKFQGTFRNILTVTQYTQIQAHINSIALIVAVVHEGQLCAYPAIVARLKQSTKERLDQ